MIAAASAMLAAFVALGLLLRAGGFAVTLDRWVQARFAPLRVRPAVLLFEWLTQAGTGGTGAAVALAASVLLWSSGRTVLVTPLWLCFVGAEVTTWSAKFIFGRVRPVFLDGITAGSPSYPSAHATVSVSVYGFVTLATWAALPVAAPGHTALLAAATAWIALICFSRLLLSLHYLSDVVGGALVGGAWVLLSWSWAQAL